MTASTISLGLKAAAYYVPGTPVSVEEWAAQNQKDAALAQSLHRHGLRHFYHAGAETICGMCAEAVSRTLAAAACDPRSVDILIYFHTIQVSVPMPPTSICTLIAEKFGMTHALGFAVSQQNCVSFLAALRVVRNLMQTHPHLRKALIAGADVAHKDGLRNIEDVGIQSDGAYAIIVERDHPHNRLLHMGFQTFGEHYAGIRSDRALGAELNQMYYLATYRLIARVIDESSVKRDQVVRLLPHNVNLPGWNRLARALKLNDGSLFSQNIPAKGHLYGGDAIVNLHDCEQEKLLRADDAFVVFSMGYGGTFGAALFKH